MNWALLSRMLGLLVMLVGGAMAFALPWAFPACGQTAEFESTGFYGLLASMACSLLVGGALFFLGRKQAGGRLLRKEALAIVGLGWMLAGLAGALPYLFGEVERRPGEAMTIADAVFESISGFTTTGASVLTHLEAPDVDDADAPRKLVPRCILFWRSFTHWLGGMGIIVLFVAVLGQLGAAGKALMRREVPGPIAESVRPRVRETALLMWAIYVGISGLLVVVYCLEGMSLFDGLCHSFGTMATGGFSTYNGSVGRFDSPLIEGTTVLFMVAAGTNFSLYYLALRPGDTPHDKLPRLIRPFVRDPEFRVYLGIIFVSTAVLTLALGLSGLYAGTGERIRHSAFTAVSIMTTTGYGTVDFHQWPEVCKCLLLILMFVGGCAGSTGGGIKVVRLLLLQKIVALEVEQAFRPNVVRPLRVFGRPVDGALRHEVIVYFALILVIFVASWLLLSAIEPDTQWLESGPQHRQEEKLLDCASAVAATLNNIGPGIGVLGPHSNYSGFSPQGKLLLTLLMLLGRLELFAILVLLVPSFWKSQ